MNRAVSGNAERTLAHVLATEVVVGLLIGAVIIPAIIWVLNPPPPTALLGKRGVIVGLAMGTLFQVLGTGVAVTLALRSRVRRGSLSAIAAQRYPWAARLPRHFMPRALLFTGIALAVLVPVALGICALLHLYPLSKLQFAALNSFYGALVAILVTPVVAIAALSDR